MEGKKRNWQGACKATRTHIISNWTDGSRVYAHALPKRVQPSRKATYAMETLIQSMFNFDGKFPF